MQVKLTETQKKDAVEFVRSGVRAKLRYEEKQFAFKTDASDSGKKKGSEPSEGDKNRYYAALEDQDYGNEIAKLYAGDDNLAMEAIEGFEGSADIKYIDRTDRGITFYFDDGTEESVSFYNIEGKERGVDSFVRAVHKILLGDDANADQAVAGAQKWMGKTLNKNLQNQGNLPFKKAAEKVISILPDDALRLPQAQSAEKLKQQLEGFGLTIEPVGSNTLGYNELKITNKGGDSIKISTNFYDDKKHGVLGDYKVGRADAYNKLKEFLKNSMSASNFTEEERDELEVELNKNWKSRTAKPKPVTPATPKPGSQKPGQQAPKPGR
jgi:hypothetical protein